MIFRLFVIPSSMVGLISMQRVTYQVYNLLLYTRAIQIDSTVDTQMWLTMLMIGKTLLQLVYKLYV